ncbi:hypothetical protein U9M48_025546 [Paspalum notatum var. saurae]|uniref:Uncharacterized protein n=1 Tax=Paspalum notatum var. saurae TaxID=547442 RepID=A0AAQ3TPV2_PASNO
MALGSLSGARSTGRSGAGGRVARGWRGGQATARTTGQSGGAAPEAELHRDGERGPMTGGAHSHAGTPRHQTACENRLGVANGAILSCNSYIPQAVWSLQHRQFTSDLKILPLQHYDLILGMDWLEAHSPMKIHWKYKWLMIPYQGSSMLLHGQDSLMTEEVLVQVCQLAVQDQLDLVQQSVPPVVSALLSEFAHVFEPVSSLPPKHHCDHVIPLVPGAQPVSVRPYRYPSALKDEIETQVHDLLHKGLIQPSSSPFSSPMLLVKKKDGSWRPVVDYRYLNALTVCGKFPIPVFDETMDELAGSSWFSTLDLNSGFHQIRLKAGEEPKTAFQTHFGHFEFKVMSFGLCGAPRTFQGAMNVTLQPLLRRCVVVFFDDILVYSKSFEEHLVHLRQVFNLLAQDKWQVKMTKCTFAQRQIAYLGHILSQERISTDPGKISAISEWPVPANSKELRSFLGLAGYYWKFVRHFAIVSKPLTELLKKNSLFVWTADHQSAFDTLIMFCTDACGAGIGAVLLQNGHPLAYISRPLGPKTAGLSSMRKNIWQLFLRWTNGDHICNTKNFSSTLINRVFTKLLGLQYKVIYKPGPTNRVADALSHHAHPEVQYGCLLSSKDPEAQALITKLAVSPDAVPNFSLASGLLRHKHSIWLGNNIPLQQQILSVLHSGPLGGHLGFPVTYRCIKQLFSWKGMKNDIKLFVCVQAKPDRSKMPGLLLPLPVPSSAWQIISMDFVEGLPRSSGHDCILVVVDKFTKYAHFLALAHPFNAARVAKVYHLHGLPESIVSDRDRVFTSLFWQELFRLAGVALRMSSSYHPQSDGQTERVNQCMETFLRCYVHACPAKWMDWLSLAEYWYNISLHSALGTSPFEALYGRPPRSLGLVPADLCPVPDLSQWLQEKEVMNCLLQQHLLRARLQMKRQADKHRSERKFEVGDSVFVKLQPYVQSSLAPRANQKLAFKFFGPFTVSSKVNEVAYKLALPSSSSVHPVFHVSMLKKAPPAGSQVTDVIPDLDASLQFPVRILARRVVPKGTFSVAQVLVQWSGWPSSMSTWEDRDHLLQRFPAAPAWGHAGSKEGGGDVIAAHGTQTESSVQTEDGPRQGIRPRKPSVRVSGSEWV